MEIYWFQIAWEVRTLMRPATLLKKRLWYRCFVKFLRTPFSQSNYWQLLLNWVGLTTLLSIFIFLIYQINLFTFLYRFIKWSILTIYKWSKIRAWYAFWLSTNEIQPWKFIGKNLKILPCFCGFLGLAVRFIKFIARI